MRMNVIFTRDRMIASRLGDFFVGVGFLLVAAWGGVALWRSWREGGGDLTLWAGLYGCVAVVVVPVGVYLVLKWSKLVLDFRAGTYVYKRGLAGGVRARRRIEAIGRIHLREEGRLNYARHAEGTPDAVYNVFIAGIGPEEIVLGEWRREGPARRFAEKVAGRAGLEVERICKPL